MRSSDYLLVFPRSCVLKGEFGYMNSGEERQVIRKERIPKKGSGSELGKRSEAHWTQAKKRVVTFYESFA